MRWPYRYSHIGGVVETALAADKFPNPARLCVVLQRFVAGPSLTDVN